MPSFARITGDQDGGPSNSMFSRKNRVLYCEERGEREKKLGKGEGERFWPARGSEKKTM